MGPVPIFDGPLRSHFSFGSPMSSKIKTGRSSSAFSTACNPSDASPMICKSGLPCSVSHRKRLNGSKSSTTRIRTTADEFRISDFLLLKVHLKCLFYIFAPIEEWRPAPKCAKGPRSQEANARFKDRDFGFCASKLRRETGRLLLTRKARAIPKMNFQVDVKHTSLLSPRILGLRRVHDGKGDWCSLELPSGNCLRSSDPKVAITNSTTVPSLASRSRMCVLPSTKWNRRASVGRTDTFTRPGRPSDC